MPGVEQAAEIFVAVGFRPENGVGLVNQQVAYLARRKLTSLVNGPIVGRAYAQPELMKPDPHPIRLALDELGVPAEAVLLVGDSTSDVVAARAVGINCVGYANRPGKQDRLAGADVVLDDLQALADALARVPLSSADA
jgi:phosphoglycolate phosphatase-like HAD superfamily hydrolase